MQNLINADMRTLRTPVISLFFPIKVVAKKYRGFEIPADMTGLWRYLNCAYQREEFIKTCPAEREIQFAYLDVAKRIK